MNTFVVDASVALKWVVAETASDKAASLGRADRLLAPELLVAETANALWKKVARGEMSADEALIAAKTLRHAQVEIVPMRGLLSEALDLAMALGHPAYDCFYLALAALERCPLVTADDRLLRKVASISAPSLPSVIGLDEASAALPISRSSRS